MLSIRSCLLVLALLAPWVCGAHDSPEHVIAMLTVRMEQTGETADLLWRRAAEQRALGNEAAAATDLKRAIRLRSNFLPAFVDLSRVQLGLGQHRRALRTVEQAMRLVDDEAGRAPLHMLKAEVFAEVGRLSDGLTECNLALASSTGAELDWYLTRSQIQCRLGLYRDAVVGLRQGFDLTGSAVLEVECIDAMIDAGEFAEALIKVETALKETRLRSSWLLRRARIGLGLGRISSAHQDLADAIVEMNSRVNPAHPESGLLAERGFAYVLLGDVELAKRDLTLARKSGADAVMLRRLELALATAR